MRATSFSGYFSRGKTKRTRLPAQPSFSCGLVSSWHITHALARHVASPSVGIYARLRMQTRSNLTDVASKAGDSSFLPRYSTIFGLLQALFRDKIIAPGLRSCTIFFFLRPRNKANSGAAALVWVRRLISRPPPSIHRGAFLRFHASTLPRFLSPLFSFRALGVYTQRSHWIRCFATI